MTKLAVPASRWLALLAPVAHATTTAGVSGDALTIDGGAGTDMRFRCPGTATLTTSALRTCSSPIVAASRRAPAAPRRASRQCAVRARALRAARSHWAPATTGSGHSWPCRRISGGDGNDRLEAGAGDDTVDGEGGNDELQNGDGNDVLSGDDGDDVLTGTSHIRDGADSLIGGAGTDELSYKLRTGPSIHRHVRWPGQRWEARGCSVQDASERNEGDNVASDIEVVRGGTGTDHLTGDDRANVLLGGTGADALRGGQGNDLLDGQEGGDIPVHGDKGGDDLLIGGLGEDRIYGGPGAMVRSDVRGEQRGGRGRLTVTESSCATTAATSPCAHPPRLTGWLPTQATRSTAAPRSSEDALSPPSCAARSIATSSGRVDSAGGSASRCAARPPASWRSSWPPRRACQAARPAQPGRRGAESTSEPGKTYFVVRLEKGVVKRLLRPKRWTVTIRVTAVTGILE